MYEQEFNRQLANLIHKGYPRILNLSETELRKQVEPLKEQLSHITGDPTTPNEGYAPFILVVQGDKFDGYETMQLVERNGKSGFSVMDTEDLRKFKPIDSIDIPNGTIYLAVDIDTGKDTLNVTPNEAIKTITAQNRSPLTIEEGIALITHFPQLVRKNNGFSLLASRCGDRRVSALWISQGKPKLGWCWAGNPHTWLGSASCKERII